jgi:hypothetical protein
MGECYKNSEIQNISINYMIPENILEGHAFSFVMAAN